MKKIFIMAVLLIGMSVVAGAQEKALGIRFGYGLEASYQHTVSAGDFLEVNLGIFNGATAINLTATYNFMLFRPNWTTKGEWGFYAGPGLSFGFLFKEKFPTLSAVGQVGLEYTFWFPLQLSFDIRPHIGLMLGEKVKFYTYGVYPGVLPTLSVRYSF